MKFNADKCSVLHFGHNNPRYEYTMNGKKLQRKEEEKDLGLYVSSFMKFGKQCAESVKKANKVLGMIKRNLVNFDKGIMLKV